MKSYTFTRIETSAIKVGINLPVRVLAKSAAFFVSLGFTLDHQLSNDKVACVVISSGINAMLVRESFFETISRRRRADTRQVREVLVQLMVDSRARVDELVDKALAAGGQPVNARNDMGPIYGRSFEDLDGHMWDVFHVEG